MSKHAERLIVSVVAAAKVSGHVGWEICA